MKIGIIGASAVGSAIARYALQAGHEVALASRHPDKLAGAVASLGAGARAATAVEAATAELVILAVPWTAREGALGAVPNWTRSPRFCQRSRH